MYQAVRGTGGTVRLVMLPHESHGYAARESVEHVLAETGVRPNRLVGFDPAAGESRDAPTAVRAHEVAHLGGGHESQLGVLLLRRVQPQHRRDREDLGIHAGLAQVLGQ